MGGFLGRYRYSLDSKGRVSLPAPFHRDAASDAFVLIGFHPEALTLYPEDTWVDVEKRLREMIERRPEFRPHVLQLTGNAVRTSPDGKGRILIPDHLRTEAGLEDEALIVGALDKIEIWDPERFEEHTAGENEEFERLAASIFA